MKVSMNGFRRGLSNEVRVLRDAIEDVVLGKHYENEELLTAINDVICRSNALNCIYTEGDPDFVEMASVEVEILEIKTKEYVVPRQDRRYRCAQCEELCDPTKHDGAYDAVSLKPVCPGCESSW